MVWSNGLKPIVKENSETTIKKRTLTKAMFDSFEGDEMKW